MPTLFPASAVSAPAELTTHPASTPFNVTLLIVVYNFFRCSDGPHDHFQHRARSLVPVRGRDTAQR